MPYKTGLNKIPEWSFITPPVFCVLIFTLLCSLPSNAQPNKRTNIWYFSDSVSMDFNSGEPVEIIGCPITGLGWGSTATMCDTNGTLLFFSDGDSIWNRNNDTMVNGHGGDDFAQGSQSVICLPKPGSDSLFYIFTARWYEDFNPMFYTTINMNGNNGLGEVADRDTLDAGWDASDQLTAVYHKNKEDYWVLTRKYQEDKFASFLVTSQGVNKDPVLSPAPNKDYMGDNKFGHMKVSYDKKYLVTVWRGSGSSRTGVELCKFNAETGEVEYLSFFRLRDIIPNNPWYMTYNFDFSPCSKYMYLSGHLSQDSSCHIYQFDMQYIEDSVLFEQSAIKIGEGQGINIQLAPDGKIYLFYRSQLLPKIPNRYVGIIHHPEKHGPACNYQPNAFTLTHGHVATSFVNFATDFLFRFDFVGICESDTFTFDPWFFPEPDYIEWNFGDPLSGANNTSIIPHAKHVFSDGGTYEVSVHVEYPGGRIEETSRKVEVEYSPEPDLGPDTVICKGSELVLNAACGNHFYSWSTGAIGTSQIMISDTGWYWVRVENDAGCYEIDSIHISNYPPLFPDTTNLQVIPTTCGGSMGAINGLEFSGTSPFSYVWTDDTGDTISNNLDLFHLGVGNYTMHVRDGNGCNTLMGPYTIHDAGDVLIEDVTYSSEYCDQQNGSITVTATSGLAAMLFYSLDNGGTYYNNQGIFTGLPAGSYAVRVRDSTDCQDVYLYNPIIIENIPGPQIDNVIVTPSLVGQNNGTIEITASGTSDTLYYSNDNGSSYQINNGWFPNLPPGFYNCIVMDENGCDTTFVVEVTEEAMLRLQAIAGDDEACPGNAAFVPLIVTNFQDVATFRTNLLYNNSLIECQGFANANTLLEDSLEVMVYPAEGRIELSWSSAPVTLPQQSILTDLVFSSTIPGINQVEWDGQAGSSYFLNSMGVNIPVDYYMGNVKIYNEVIVDLELVLEACENEDVTITPQLISSNGEVSYLWTYPNGDTSHKQTQILNNIQINEAGIYQLSVSDTALCTTNETINISIYENPVPAFSGQDTIITETPVEIDAGADQASYQWTSGETGRFITAIYEGWYGVFIESLQGCYGEDSVYVLFATPPPVEPQDSPIFIPNAFSPNGDGLNDEFKVITTSSQITSFHVYIYNRWGEQIFESSDISRGWDGEYKSQQCPGGAYVYKIEYMLGSLAEIRTMSGVVVLVR